MRSPKHEYLLETTWRLPLASLLSLIATVVTLGGVTLHLMGSATHTTYLSHWGLDAGLFPKATDWMLINGYSTAFDRGIAFFKLMSANAVGSLAMFFVASVSWALFQSSVNSGKQPAQLEIPRAGARNFLRNGLVALLMGCSVFLLSLALLTIAAVPVAMGAATGKAAVEREMRDFAKGCEEAISSCIELKKGSELIGVGFILDSSPTHIAIFDVNLQKARSIPREGVETVAARMPKFP